MEQRNTFYIVTALVFGFAIGFFAGKGVVTPVPQTAESPNAQGSWPNSFVVPSDADPRSVSGKVVLLSGSVVALHALFADETIKITIGKDTKIIKLVPEDPQTYRDEIVAYHKAVPTPVAPPSGFREIPAHISDLHPGDDITVTAASIIKGRESFTALEIRILAAQ